MNIQATNRLTPAETALVDAYTAKFSELPGDGGGLLPLHRRHETRGPSA